LPTATQCREEQQCGEQIVALHGDEFITYIVVSDSCTSTMRSLYHFDLCFLKMYVLMSTIEIRSVTTAVSTILSRQKWLRERTTIPRSTYAAYIVQHKS
jgi:hypothetical protein